MIIDQRRAALTLFISACLLQGCGGGGDSDAAPRERESSGGYTVSANVTGLNGRLDSGQYAFFRLDYTDPAGAGQFTSLGVNADGPFTFASTYLPDATAYRVSYSHSDGDSVRCAVENGEGVVAAANVTGVEIACAAAYTLRGAVRGINALSSGLAVAVLHNGEPAPTYANGFTAATNEFYGGGANGFLPGDAYDVRITQQPTNPDVECIVRNASGVMAEADVTNIEFLCKSIDVFYEVEGLVGAGMMLELRAERESGGSPQWQNVGTHALTGNGAFQFTNALYPGEAYELAITQQPTAPDQECIVENGAGVAPELGAASGVVVVCPQAFRRWQFDNQLTRETDAPLESGVHVAGVLYRTFAFGPGPAVPLGSISGYDDTELFQLHIDNDGAEGVVYSNHSGKTFWVGAESPAGVRYPSLGGSHHNITELDAWWRFRKDSSDAQLQLEVTEVNLLAYDDTHASDAGGRLYAEAQLWVNAHRQAGDGVYNEQVFSRHGGVALQGKLLGSGASTDWSIFTATDPAAEYGLWNIDNFYFDLIGDEAGLRIDQLAIAFLLDPIPIPIDISGVPIGEEFYVNARTLVLARNSFSPEGGTVAYLRDPATFEAGDPADPNGFDDPGSVRIVSANGVTMLALDEEPVAAPGAGASAPPACESDQRGAIAFEQAQYEVAEGAENSTLIRVVREGTPAGRVSARVRLVAGSASVDADFESREIEVRFGDLDNAPRDVALPIVDDGEIENAEDLTLELVDPQGCAQIGAQATALVTIVDDDTPPGPPTYALGGTVTGLLGGGLVLTNLSTNELPIASDGPFAFATTFASGSRYEVRVSAQPQSPRQFCEVANGGGTIADADVANIEVTCATLPDEGAALDPTFGVGGRAAPGAFPAAADLALQADGALVVVGPGSLGRYTADGVLDATFGVGGVAPVSFYGASDTLTAVAVQSDGAIVVGGYSRNGVNSPVQEDFVAARYTSAGALDASFNGGQVITDFQSRGDGAYEALIQPDGRIVLAGGATVVNGFGQSDSDFAAARYDADGALDLSFDADGRNNANLAGLVDIGQAAALQPDGKILIAGRVANSGGADPDVGLVRFNADGSVDTGFGVNGVVRDQTAEWDEAADVVVQPDGRIIVVGHASPSFTPMLLIARYNADGSPDASFGANGRVLHPRIEVGKAVALQVDGRIVVVGRQAGDFAIARYSASGELDASFGASGVMLIDFFGGVDDPAAVAIQADGRIVVAGSATNGTDRVLGLARILP